MGSNTDPLSYYKPDDGETGWASTKNSDIQDQNDRLTHLPSERVEINGQDSPYSASFAELIFADTSNGAITINLPDPGSGDAGSGAVGIIVEDSTNDVTVSRNGSEDIDGSASDLTLTVESAVVLVSEGTNWRSQSKVGQLGAVTIEDVDTTNSLELGPSGGILSGVAWADDGNFYDTVQAAQDAATSLVIIGEGTFEEAVTFDTPHLQVTGQGKATIIDGGTTGPAVTAGDGGAENQQFKDFNVAVTQGGGVSAAVNTAADAGNEYEFHNVRVEEDIGATVGFDIRNGDFKELRGCTASFTSGDSFKTEETTAVACHADIDVGGVGFDANNRSRLIGCVVHNAMGNSAYSLGGSQAMGCSAYGSAATFGHFELAGRSVAVGCYSHGAPSDYAFDLVGNDASAGLCTVESPGASQAVRVRGNDNDVESFNFRDLGSTNRYNYSAATRAVINGKVVAPETLDLGGTDGVVSPTYIDVVVVPFLIDAGGSATELEGIDGDLRQEGQTVRVIHTGGENVTLANNDTAENGTLINKSGGNVTLGTNGDMAEYTWSTQASKWIGGEVATQ